MATNSDTAGGPPQPAGSLSPVERACTKDTVVFRPQGIPRIAQAFLSTKPGVRRSDVTSFLRQLIMLLEAGTPILKSLKTLAERSGRASSRRERRSRAATRDLIADITQYVEGGNPLWQAFDRHARHFDSVFVNLVKASEASGTLVTVLQRMVKYREERELLGKRVRGAMIYPVILVVACFGVMLLLTKLVVPEFEAMFERAKLEIPAATEWFLRTSNLFSSYWWVPIAAVVLLWLLYSFWYVRNPLRRLRADRIKLHLPVVGPIVHKNAIVELTRTMSLLLRSGLSMMATLELTRDAIHNRAVAEVLQALRNSIEKGEGMEAPLRAAAPTIPDEVGDMFITGEESGRVDAVADQVADLYEQEVQIAVESLGEALQPIFTVVVGLVVLVLFASLFYPLVTMIEQLSSASM